MSPNATSQPWDHWQKHFGAVRPDTMLAILTSLRETYPDLTVTVADSSTGLLPYAEAGNAEAALDNKGEAYASVRQYRSADRRSSVDSGHMEDEVRFGGYDYKWKKNEFLVYYIDWLENPFFEHRVQCYFILYKRTGMSADDVRPKVVDGLIAASTKWNKNLHNEVWVFDQEEWNKSTNLWKSVQQSKWDDVILDPDIKNALINDVEGFFDNEVEYREFAVPFKRGIVLHGSPGNGKSLSIKALMHSLSTRPDPIPALYVKTFAGCHNEAYAIRQVFEKARSTTPCLLIFEDLDSLVKEKVRSFFLNEVDGLEDNDGLMIIGSTNYLEKLDPSITKRPSRFDRKYHFALPATAERIRYCEYWRGKLAQNRKIDFPKQLCKAIAEITEGFSFAYMKELFITCLLAIVNAQQTGAKEIDGIAEVDGEAKGEVNGEVDGLTNTKVNRHEDTLLWRVMNKQVKLLRVDMEDARKSEEEAANKEIEDKEKKKNRTNGTAEQDAEDDSDEDC